jgi:hypothetical protein
VFLRDFVYFGRASPLVCFSLSPFYASCPLLVFAPPFPLPYQRAGFGHEAQVGQDFAQPFLRVVGQVVAHVPDALEAAHGGSLPSTGPHHR